MDRIPKNDRDRGLISSRLDDAMQAITPTFSTYRGTKRSVCSRSILYICCSLSVSRKGPGKDLYTALLPQQVMNLTRGQRSIYSLKKPLDQMDGTSEGTFSRVIFEPMRASPAYVIAVISRGLHPPLSQKNRLKLRKKSSFL